MARVSVSVSVQGKSPLLIHRFGEGSEQRSAHRRIDLQQVDPRAEAEKVVYRSPEGWLYVPGTWFAGCLRSAGAGMKARGSRRSLRFIIPSAVLIREDILPLVDASGKLIRNFEVDSRPVTIPATKGRVMRHRPRLNDWGCSFTMEISEEMMSVDTVNQILVEGGECHGVGDFRPSKSGPFGRFMVTKYEKLEDVESEGKRQGDIAVRLNT